MEKIQVMNSPTVRVDPRIPIIHPIMGIPVMLNEEKDGKGKVVIQRREMSLGSLLSDCVMNSQVPFRPGPNSKFLQKRHAEKLTSLGLRVRRSGPLILTKEEAQILHDSVENSPMGYAPWLKAQAFYYLGTGEFDPEEKLLIEEDLIAPAKKWLEDNPPNDEGKLSAEVSGESKEAPSATAQE